MNLQIAVVAALTLSACNQGHDRDFAKKEKKSTPTVTGKNNDSSDSSSKSSVDIPEKKTNKASTLDQNQEVAPKVSKTKPKIENNEASGAQEFSKMSTLVGFTIPTCLHCHKVEGAAEYSTLEGLRAGAGNSLEFVRNRLDETNHGIGGNIFGRPKVYLFSDRLKDAMAYGIINGYETLDENDEFNKSTKDFLNDEELATWADIAWQTCGSCHNDDGRSKGRVSAFGIRDNYSLDQILAKAGSGAHGKGAKDHPFPFAGDLGKRELRAIAADMKARDDDTIKSLFGIVQSDSDSCMGCH